MPSDSLFWLALDIGGANLKAADGVGYAVSKPFPLWATPDRLAVEIGGMLDAAPPCRRLAVTMTGELADCFESKAAGVRFILDAVARAAGNREFWVYLTTGEFVAPATAREAPLLAAASNWRALAEYCLRYVGDSPALLIDVGSTTTDIIPLVSGRVAAAGATDTQRLMAGELVYAGVARTSVCSLVDSVPYRGRNCPIAREFFATLQDVYLVLGDLAEVPHDRSTADHRPATRSAAQARLARMICADATEFDDGDALLVARSVAQRHLEITVAALRQVIAALPQSPATVIFSGEGEFFARRLVEAARETSLCVSLSAQIGAAASRCAPAYALAVLARETI